MSNDACDVLVIGGGPAGLRAAEIVSAAGRRTILADHKPSVGRKFLVAGRGGLNLTHSEPVAHFPARYGTAPGRWPSLLADFSPDDLRGWAKELGVETFIGTSGRVFPESKQAAPLLRRWIERLRQQGVSFRARHELSAIAPASNGAWNVAFISPRGTVTIPTRVLILALGGASWPQTGSDGSWVPLLAKLGVSITPFAPANCGYEVAWPTEFLAVAEGLPLKNIAATASNLTVSGELLVTQYGLEGGALYQLGPLLRAQAKPEITLDLKPTFTHERLLSKLGNARGLALLNRARASWRLGEVAHALLKLQNVDDQAQLASLAKAYPIALIGPRPIAEAISSAGGVSWSALDDDLMVRAKQGLFCAGEMIDWEAPTGGYLLQGCFSTATRAARGALGFLQKSAS